MQLGAGWAIDRQTVQVQSETLPLACSCMQSQTQQLQLGKGLDAFHKAKAALQSWQQMELGWVTTNKPPVRQGANVCVAANLFGLWLRNPLRIVYVRDVERSERRGVLRHRQLQGKVT